MKLQDKYEFKSTGEDMATSCFKVLSHYIPERMRKILISFYQDGLSVD